MAKDVFKEDLGDVLEFDDTLDINTVLGSIPAIEDSIKNPPAKEEDKVKKDGGKKEPSLENIDKVLEKQSTETDKDKKIVDKVVEDIEKTDDKASASLNKTTDDTSDAPFTVIFARDLVTQGLLSSFNEKKFIEDSKDLGEAEALRNLIKSEIDTNTEAITKDLDAGYQEYLSLIGKGVPAESAGDLLSLKTRFDGIKLDELIKEENVDLRKQVMTDYYKLTTKMSDSKIEKAVKNSIDLGEDIEDSKEQLTTLKGIIKDEITAEEQEAQRVQKLQEEENRRSRESLQEGINSLGEIIPGVQINKQTKVKMFEDITKPVQDNKGRTTNAIWAKRSEDPMFFDSRIAYLLETGYFEKGKVWNKVSQAKTTTEISELEKALQGKSNTGTKSGSHVIKTLTEEDKTSKSNIDSMRGIFDK
jgi:hypothetical protein